MQTVRFATAFVGLTSPRLFLFDSAGVAVGDVAGYALTETPASSAHYVASVADSVTGSDLVALLRANGTADVLHDDYVTLTGTTGSVAIVGPVVTVNAVLPEVRESIASASAAAVVATLAGDLADIEISARLPVTETGDITPLTRGDDYLAVHGRQLAWTIPLPNVDTTGATCHFGGQAGSNRWLVEGTVSRDGDDVTLTFDLPSEATVDLDPGIYYWTAELRSSAGKRMTQIGGSVPLEDSYTIPVA